MADPGDDLTRVLADWSADPVPARLAAAYAALVDAVVLLPTRATAVGEQVADRTGLRAEREAEVALLTVSIGDPSDGRQVLPVFTSASLMLNWRIDARPVQVPVRDACRAAVEAGWQGLVVDPGTLDLVLGPAAVRALAAGFLPVAGQESVSVGSLAAADLLPASVLEAPPDLVAALRRGVAREPAVAAAWLMQVLPAVEVGLVTRVELGPAGLATIASRLAARLPGAAGGDAAVGLFAVAALDPAGADAVAAYCVRLWP